MNKKAIWWVVAIAIIITIIVYSNTASKGENIRIGMILPLSGSAAQYGEQLKNGAEIAKTELKSKGVIINVIYEDSRADPTAAISAYRKLVDLDKVDYIVSAMTRATLPLVDLVKRDKIPMVMTLVAGDWDKSKSGYVVRFYPTARQYVRGNDEDKVLNGLHSVGVIYVNDAYGQSVLKEIQEFATEKGFKVGLAEGYLPSNQDYRLSLSKLKNSNVDLIMMVSSSPVELSTIAKQYKELAITKKLFDASIGLSNPNVRINNKEVLEGVVTRATKAELTNKGASAQAFFDEYIRSYKDEPYFSAIFGYESINLLMNIDRQSGSNFIEKSLKLKSVSTIMGDFVINDYQEINPPIYNTVIQNGELVTF